MAEAFVMEKIRFGRGLKDRFRWQLYAPCRSLTNNASSLLGKIANILWPCASRYSRPEPDIASRRQNPTIEADVGEVMELAANAKVLRWFREYRAYCSIGLLVIAGLMLMHRAEMRAPAEKTLTVRDAMLKYVGPIEKAISRSGTNHGTTKFDAGLGIGVANYIDHDELMLRLRPVLYLPFASILSVTQEQAGAVEAAGPRLRIGMHLGEVVTLEGAAGPVLSYQAYVGKIEQRRDFWLMGAIVAAAVALVIYVGTSRVRTRE
ncbi:hypothetical protein [Variovorax paradoxus]|jgi:hypothetical protein